MLFFNPKRIMALRGIDRMFSFLHKNGFIRTTSSNLLSGAVSYIKVEHLGRICVLLNCTPNDLFAWQPDAQNHLPADHALNSLVREQKGAKSINELIKDVPVERLLEIENLLKGVKDG